MNWSDVGSFLKQNQKGVAGLVGSLLTGNVVGAVSAGASMVAQATGTTDPDQALAEFKKNHDVNRHLESVMALELQDAQRSHSETQQTIRNGDNAEGGVKYVRPTHATLSLVAGIVYAFITESPDLMILGAFLTLPFTYAGLRAIDKRNVLAFANKK